MAAVLDTLFWALIPTLFLIVGGSVALFKQPSAAVRGIILHFAAGVVFSVVAVELLPDIVKRHAPIEIVIGFSAGIAVMLGLKSFSRKLEEHDQEKALVKLPSGMLFGIAVDLILDGLLLGIGFAAGNSAGIMLAIALSLELLALGLATSTSLVEKGITRRKILIVIAILSSLIILACTAGATFLRQLDSDRLEVVLSFGLAALLFLVTEELLVEAHEAPETPLHTASFFLGFLILLLLGMVAQ